MANKFYEFTFNGKAVLLGKHLQIDSISPIDGKEGSIISASGIRYGCDQTVEKIKAILEAE